MKFQNNSDTIVLSDSFKSTISSKSIGELWHKRCGFDFLPVSDGGEGALEAIDSVLEGYYKTINGIDVYIDNKTAYIETAKIVGYDTSKDVYLRNSADLGKLIEQLAERKMLKLVIFIGGTSTNDGGFGVLEALGYEFLDDDGHSVVPIPLNFERISAVRSKELPLLEIVACTDVKNELCGRQGATHIYGSQKGVKNHEELDAQIKRIAFLIDSEKAKLSGTGAGGGIGYALAQFEHFAFIDGYSYISKLADYPKIISNYKKVITGEGKLDSQTINGKLPYRILQEAKKYAIDTHGVFAVIEESELISDFKSVNYIAVNNEASAENFKNTRQNYNNYITTYKYKTGTYSNAIFSLNASLSEEEELKKLTFIDKLIEKQIKVTVLPDSESLCGVLEALDCSPYECIGITDAQDGIDALNRAGIDSLSIGEGLQETTLKINTMKQLSLDLLEQIK